METKEETLESKDLTGLGSGGSISNVVNVHYSDVTGQQILHQSSSSMPIYSYGIDSIVPNKAYTTLEDIHIEITKMEFKLSALKDELQKLAAEDNNKKAESRLKNLFKKD